MARLVLRAPRQAIDLFLPHGVSAAPIMAFIHGGYWQSRDRKDFSFVAGPWLERGVAVALLGYDLAPTVRMDAIVAEVRAGLAWLYRQAPAHGCDPTRLHVAGHSAGGHLAAVTLMTDWAGFGLPENMIKGVCAISGVFDLEPIRRCYLNEVVGLDTDEAHRNSPLHQPLHGSRATAGNPNCWCSPRSIISPSSCAWARRALRSCRRWRARWDSTPRRLDRSGS
jgi:arylformamidase